MTHDEIALVLGKCAGVDQRTVGRADVLAWHELIGHLSLADALEAVKRWYGTRRDRIMPSDVIDGCKAIRNERAENQPHEVRALPSRFEADQVRDERIQRGVRDLAQRWTIPDNDTSDPIRERALERARRERGKRPIPGRDKARNFDRGQPAKVTTKPPSWADPAARERESVNALHAAGHHCGKSACPRCTQALAETQAAQQETP